ncbi:MAG: hypothetical protein KC468_39020, partial [Myxococcales bacterium]|nr:hypothetical protein [Myxococcales bacterium]
GHAGRWAILNTRSSVEPFLEYSTRRDLLEKVWRTFVNRGDNGDAHDNNLLITEILKLRAERAALLGYPTHAHWRIEDQMAKTPERALALLEDPALAEQLADVANKNGVGAQLRFELARDAARRGDVEAARALLDEILKDDDLRLQFVDRIAARPELRSIQKVSSSPSRARP